MWKWRCFLRNGCSYSLFLCWREGGHRCQMTAIISPGQQLHASFNRGISAGHRTDTLVEQSLQSQLSTYHTFTHSINPPNHFSGSLFPGGFSEDIADHYQTLFCLTTTQKANSLKKIRHFSLFNRMLTMLLERLSPRNSFPRYSVETKRKHSSLNTSN